MREPRYCVRRIPTWQIGFTYAVFDRSDRKFVTRRARERRTAERQCVRFNSAWDRFNTKAASDYALP